MRLLSVVALFAAACHPQEQGDGTPTPPLVTSPATGGPVSSPIPEALTMEELPNLWTIAAPWTHHVVHPCGDLDGDGRDDIEISLYDDQSDIEIDLIGFAPRLAPRVIPGPDDVQIASDWSSGDCGDVTGDGIADLFIVQRAEPYELRLVEGPLDRTPLDGQSGTTVDWLGRSLADLDGDGVLDAWQLVRVGEADRLEIWWGPDAWVEPAFDVAIEPSCSLEYLATLTDTYVRPPAVRTWPDVNGDGVRELFVSDFSLNTGCGAYLLPLPTSGVIDPDTAPGGVVGFPRLEFMRVVPDQTGDGIQDAWLWDHMAASPLTFSPAGIMSDVEIPIDPTIDIITELPVDTDGDSISDFLLHDDATGLFQVHTGGWNLQDVELDDDRPAWILDGGRSWWAQVGRPFIEDGHVGSIVDSGTRVAAIDLGPIQP